MTLPRVNVIIPAFNEEQVIQDCIRALKTQTYSNFKVLIIDDRSTDKTRSIIQSQVDSKIELLEFGKVGPGRARNLAAKHADADLLVFTDADCVPKPDWIEQLVKGFESEQVGSTGGPQVMHSSSNNFQRKLERLFKVLSFGIDFYKPTKNEICFTRHNPLCNVAYRRRIFEKLEGFREDLFPGEDVELDLRVKNLGYSITYNPQAVVEHHRPEDISQWKKVAYAYGRAQGKLVREYGFFRPIQVGAISTLLIFHALIFALALSFDLLILGACLVLLTAFWLFRPKWNSYIGIFLNGLSWFNGFIYGVFTGNSLPPSGGLEPTPLMNAGKNK